MLAPMASKANGPLMKEPEEKYGIAMIGKVLLIAIYRKPR
jgi:hypothetical protein